MPMPGDNFVQVAPDSSGKRLAMIQALLRAGTPVLNADGTVTTLAADTTVYIEKVVITDTMGRPILDFAGLDRQEAMLQELRRISLGMTLLTNDPLLLEDQI